MRIVLLFSNPVRDLAGMVLLASQLCREGATCFLVPQMLWKQEISSIMPDFVLLPHMRRDRHNIYQHLLNAGIAIGILDAEGGVLSSISWYEDALYPDKQIRDQVSCYCSWGTRMVKEAQERHWFPADKVHITGHPRFDFHAPEWRSSLLMQTANEGQYARPLVLVSGRYSVANPHHEMPEIKLARLAELRNYSEEYTRNFLKAQQTGMRQLCDLTNELADEFPGINFVYRPHPFERVETYKEQGFLNERSNLIVTREGAIESWLNRCDLLIHRGCTTAIEAGMRDIAAISPRWVATPEEIESSEQVSIGCKDIAEVKAHLRELAQGRKIERPADIKDAHNTVIEDWFYQIDGLSHERVCQVILSSLEKRPVKPSEQKCRLLFKKAKGNPSSPKGYFLKAIGKWENHAVLKWKSSEGYFSAEQANKALDILKHKYPKRFGQVHIKSTLQHGSYRIPNKDGNAITVYSD